MQKESRKNEAVWVDQYQRWQIKVQRDGIRKTFLSHTEGKKGKIEAEKSADKWIGGGSLKEGIRFGSLWEDFLAEKNLLKKSPNYIAQLTWIGNSYLLPKLRHKKVASITPQDWQNCINEAYAKGLAKHSLKDIRSAMTSVCTYARKRLIAIERPFDLEIQADAPQGEKKILNKNEIITLFIKDEFINHNKKEKCQYIYAWRLILLTGLRAGEVCGLKKSDINGNILTINRAIDNYDRITSGKTQKALRRVALCDTAIEVIGEQETMLKTAGIISPWLFPDKHGDMIQPRQLYKQWIGFCKQNNIDCSIHEMRHTFISMTKADVPEQLLKEVVGHTKNMDTFGIYGHEVAGEMDRVANIINGVFLPIIKQQK